MGKGRVEPLTSSPGTPAPTHRQKHSKIIFWIHCNRWDCMNDLIAGSKKQMEQ